MSDQIKAAGAEKQSQEPHHGRRLGVAVFILMLLLATIVCALGYGYYQLSHVNIALAHQVATLQKQTTHTQNDMNTVLKSITDLQQTAQKSQELTARQEQLIADWQAAQKGDLNKWYVAEAQYLVKLANDHVQFTHNIEMGLTLLQRAAQVLENLQNPDLLQIQKSIAADIATLQSFPHVDITELYVHLSAINNQLDQLQLPASPLKSDLNQMLPTTEPQGTPWWKVGLNRSWDVLRKIVIVRNLGNSTLPLVLPEEKVFLYQNLHAQMESVLWAVLRNNPDVYQASLARMVDWVKTYFDQDSSVTHAVLQSLDEFQKINLQASTADLAATLQLFDNYFADAGTK